MPFSFVFRIDHIGPNFKSQPIHFFESGDWKPPTWGVGLSTVEPGPLYRWQSGDASIVPPGDAANVRIAQNPKKYEYDAGTVFTQTPWSQTFFAVDFDARWKNLDPDHRWEKLTFTHTQHPADPSFYYSELGIGRESYQMATLSNAEWQYDLFPQGMHCNPNNALMLSRKNAGLTGKLAFLLAIIAFSSSRQQLATVLQHCLQQPLNPASSKGRWQRLPGLVHGSTTHRGVVVTIFKDPTAAKEYQSPQWFRKLERGDLGAFLT